jgi:hypothetical protein
VKLFATWLALVVLAASTATAAAEEPQPDAAPQTPAVAPDPVPGSTPPQERSEPAQQAPPAQTQTQAPAEAPTRQTATPVPRTPPPTPAREHHRPSTQAQRADVEVDAARASSMLRIRALLPGDQTAADSSSSLFLLAAGALLALVLASGSMVSVASRAMKGQLR